MPAKRPRVLQTFDRETDEIVVQPHDAVAGLRGNDYFPGPRGSGLHHLGEDYVAFLPCDEIPTRKSSVSQVLTGTSESGASPLCYPKDVTQKMVEGYRKRTK